MSRTAIGPEQAQVSTTSSARKTWSGVAKSAGIKIVMLPVGAVVGLIITRLVITHYGEAAFGQYGLLVGIANLLPFADLGLSAAIMNAVAASDRPDQDEKVRLTLVSAFRLLAASAAVIIAVAFLITAFGDWRSLLGNGLTPTSGSLAAGLSLALIGFALPFGVGQRILTGIGQNHVSIVLTSLNRPLVLLALLVAIWTGAAIGGYVAPIVYAAAAVISLLMTVIAARRIAPAVGVALRQSLQLRTVRGARVFDVAWPMLMQMVALPIALQSDRIVLSHLSDLEQLNRYNLATQLYTPILLVMSSAGMTLWAVFARERAGIGESGTSPHRMALVFAGLGGVAAIAMSVLSPWLADLATGGEVGLPLLLLISFSVLMVAQGVNYPLGMYLTEPSGLRFQAVMILLMLPLNLGLSIWLTGPLGASGPAIGSAVGVLLCQVVANWIYVGRRRRAAGSGEVPDVTA
ncbi:oligosaccharide flippase family protein [Microlunatus elymi]|uniref:Oligosaccharide flippase family protein n=1 Tax=Microlunatus elymi TaxID=2596828 RepID=A0A516PW47_9ACTN|nr:oligosaccharide flippase family protein [Microlunatus elymi]QDP95181.1 oligosaccharide flippase family protein [Microlunatus elymi]